MNARSTYSYARSGLFLRPGGDDSTRAHTLQVGSFYRNLVRDIVPLLPTLDDVKNETGPLRDLIWCNLGERDHCMESPNRACLDEDSDCRVLLKADNDADAGTVEDMIKNSSLPLIIVYTGGSSALDAALAALPDQTFLFCTLLPAPNGPRTGP